MKLLWAAILAENEKQRRTLARWLSVLAPVTALVLSLFLLGPAESAAATQKIAFWQAYAGSVLAGWAAFLLPLMATLQAVLLSQLEHANKQWKFILALPVPRSSLYIAKSVNLVFLIVLAHLLLGMMIGLVCILAGWADFSSGLAWPMMAWLASNLAIICCASLLLASIQLLIAVEMESFVAAISIGLVAMFIGLFGNQAVGETARYFPWTMPLMAVRQPGIWLAGAFAASLAVTWIGALRMKHRQVR
jgi:hypothetical protein